jgi:hypothetical protein
MILQRSAAVGPTLRYVTDTFNHTFNCSGTIARQVLAQAHELALSNIASAR